MKTPDFDSKKELFDFLVKNKKDLIAEKKFQVKQSDPIQHYVSHINDKNEVIKSTSLSIEEVDSIKARLVVNTTNILDSHGDVHISGLWKKTLNEQKTLYLLQEHTMSFETIITSDLTTSLDQMTWKSLGFDFKGSTQALIFNANISKQRNPYMFEQYVKGYVNNHSVGMRYVKMFLCVNSDDKFHKEEKENWEKYIDQVVNKEEADKRGFFFAVTEAILVEGSAVPMGSNFATPTLEISPNKQFEADSFTSNKIIEPSIDTQKQEDKNSMYKNFI